MFKAIFGSNGNRKKFKERARARAGDGGGFSTAVDTVIRDNTNNHNNNSNFNATTATATDDGNGNGGGNTAGIGGNVNFNESLRSQSQAQRRRRRSLGKVIGNNSDDDDDTDGDDDDEHEHEHEHEHDETPSHLPSTGMSSPSPSSPPSDDDVDDEDDEMNRRIYPSQSQQQQSNSNSNANSNANGNEKTDLSKITRRLRRKHLALKYYLKWLDYAGLSSSSSSFSSSVVYKNDGSIDGGVVDVDGDGDGCLTVYDRGVRFHRSRVMRMFIKPSTTNNPVPMSIDKNENNKFTLKQLIQVTTFSTIKQNTNLSKLKRKLNHTANTSRLNRLHSTFLTALRSYTKSRLTRNVKMSYLLVKADNHNRTRAFQRVLRHLENNVLSKSNETLRMLKLETFKAINTKRRVLSKLIRNVNMKIEGRCLNDMSVLHYFCIHSPILFTKLDEYAMIRRDDRLNMGVGVEGYTQIMSTRFLRRCSLLKAARKAQTAMSILSNRHSLKTRLQTLHIHTQRIRANRLHRITLTHTSSLHYKRTQLLRLCTRIAVIRGRRITAGLSSINFTVLHRLISSHFRLWAGYAYTEMVIRTYSKARMLKNGVFRWRGFVKMCKNDRRNNKLAVAFLTGVTKLRVISSLQSYVSHRRTKHANTFKSNLMFIQKFVKAWKVYSCVDCRIVRGCKWYKRSLMTAFNGLRRYCIERCGKVYNHTIADEMYTRRCWRRFIEGLKGNCYSRWNERVNYGNAIDTFCNKRCRFTFDKLRMIVIDNANTRKALTSATNFYDTSLHKRTLQTWLTHTRTHVKLRTYIGRIRMNDVRKVFNAWVEITHLRLDFNNGVEKWVVRMGVVRMYGVVSKIFERWKGYHRNVGKARNGIKCVFLRKALNEWRNATATATKTNTNTRSQVFLRIILSRWSAYIFSVKENTVKTRTALLFYLASSNERVFRCLVWYVSKVKRERFMRCIGRVEGEVFSVRMKEEEKEKERERERERERVKNRKRENVRISELALDYRYDEYTVHPVVNDGNNIDTRARRNEDIEDVINDSKLRRREIRDGGGYYSCSYFDCSNGGGGGGNGNGNEVLNVDTGHGHGHEYEYERERERERREEERKPSYSFDLHNTIKNQDLQQQQQQRQRRQGGQDQTHPSSLASASASASSSLPVVSKSPLKSVLDYGKKGERKQPRRAIEILLDSHYDSCSRSRSSSSSSWSGGEYKNANGNGYTDFNSKYNRNLGERNGSESVIVSESLGIGIGSGSGIDRVEFEGNGSNSNGKSGLPLWILEEMNKRYTRNRNPNTGKVEIRGFQGVDCDYENWNAHAYKNTTVNGNTNKDKDEKQIYQSYNTNTNTNTYIPPLPPNTFEDFRGVLNVASPSLLSSSSPVSHSSAKYVERDVIVEKKSFGVSYNGDNGNDDDDDDEDDDDDDDDVDVGDGVPDLKEISGGSNDYDDEYDDDDDDDDQYDDEDEDGDGCNDDDEEYPQTPTRTTNVNNVNKREHGREHVHEQQDQFSILSPMSQHTHNPNDSNSDSERGQHHEDEGGDGQNKDEDEQVVVNQKIKKNLRKLQSQLYKLSLRKARYKSRMPKLLFKEWWKGKEGRVRVVVDEIERLRFFID